LTTVDTPWESRDTDRESRDTTWEFPDSGWEIRAAVWEFWDAARELRATALELWAAAWKLRAAGWKFPDTVWEPMDAANSRTDGGGFVPNATGWAADGNYNLVTLWRDAATTLKAAGVQASLPNLALVL